MHRLESDSEKDVWVGALASDDDFVSPFAGEEFALMVVHVAGALEEVQRMDLARLLVRQGCRYAVCAGLDCEEWETAFDMADLERNPDCDKERLVMTTSHEAEALDDVSWFFIQNTHTSHFNPTRFLAVAVGAQPQDIDALQLSLVKAIRDAA